MNIETVSIEWMADRLKEVEAERDELKKKLSGQTSLVMSNIDMQLEENIAQIQLAKLNEVSMQRELTLEEAKKCEIYSKILNNVRNKGAKDVNAEVRNLDTKELLKQLESSV